MNQKISAVLWDVDGTLLDFQAAERAAIKGLFETFSLGACSDETVRALNNEFRHLDKTTDVLSFPWNPDENDLVEGPFLGEIYISMPQVERQAPEYGATKRQELERVIVHGLLHLSGHDHATPSQRKKMRELEEHYLGRQLYAR